jgi:HEAT repeat protein
MNRKVLGTLAGVALLLLLFSGLSFAQSVSRRQLRTWTRLLRSDDPQERSSAATNLLSTNDASALDALIETLGKDVPENFRISIITAFGIKGDDRASAQIIAALNDPSEMVRKAATAALQGITTPNALRLLQQAARDPNQPLLIRTQTLAILGDMRAMDAIPTLIELLSDPNESISAATRTALERITLRSFATSTEWSAWWERSAKLSREEMLEDLVTLQSDRIRHLNEIVERLYLSALSERKVRTDPAPLIAAFNESESPKVRLYAIQELAAFEGPEADVMGTLIQAMSDPDATVRLGVAKALGTIGDPNAADALMAALGDPASQVRAAAARSLGAIEAKSAAPALCALLADPAEEVAIAAAGALGEIADPVALDPLIRIVKSDNVSAGLYEASANALARMKDPRAVPGLIGLLASKEDQIRWAAVDALGNLRAPEGIQPLSLLAREDPNPQNREAALAALNKIGDVSVWETMLQSLYDKDKRVSDQARRSLLHLAEVDSSVYGMVIDRLLADGRYDLADWMLSGALEHYAKSANNTAEVNALRNRMAQGLLAAKEWGRAKPHLEAIVAKSPRDQSALKDLAICLNGLADYGALLALYSQARRSLPEDSGYWWQETARTLEQMAAVGASQQAVAAVDALEKEDANLGGAAVAPRIREARRKAQEALGPVLTITPSTSTAPPTPDMQPLAP